MALVLAASIVGAASAATNTRTLTIYSSLPLQGTSRGQSRAVVRGEKLALRDAGSKAGGHRIRLVSLDDSTKRNPGTADERQTARNARRAAGDASTIAYIGEFNSGGTKVSLPILNRKSIAQISPSNTYIGLTSDGPGSERGEPGKYYPTNRRTYARIQPNDRVQGAALATLMRQDGCATVTVWHDGSTYGRAVAANAKATAPGLGLTLVGTYTTKRSAPNYRAVAARVTSDCFLWAGVTGENAVRVFEDVAAAAPAARLYGPDGIGESAFADPREGGVRASVGARMKITISTISPSDLPGAADVVSRYRRAYGGPVDPYAIYGYEAMALALDAIGRAGDKADSRRAVAAALLATANRQSVLGTYSIDARGDTTLRDFGVYAIRGGQLGYAGKIVAAG